VVYEGRGVLFRLLTSRKGQILFRFSLLAALVLMCAVVLSSALQPAEAVNVRKFTLEAGRHEIELENQTLIIETNEDLVVSFQSREDFVSGIIEAAHAGQVAHVRIILVGPPDRVIFGGDVSGPTPFDSNSPEETGGSDL